MFRTGVTSSSSNRIPNNRLFGFKNRWPQRFSSTSYNPLTTSATTSGAHNQTPHPFAIPRFANNWTSSTAQTTNSSDTYLGRAVIVSVVEGRGQAKGEIGFAAIDLKNPIMVLSQFNDNALYECLLTKCYVFTPLEIIIPNTLYREQLAENRLFQLLSQEFPSVKITAVERKQFSETNGLNIVRELCCEEVIDIELKAKYYCLSASAALINYIESIFHTVFAPKSVKVVYEGSDNTMTIDPTTAKLLELIVNLSDSKSNETLFGILNRTKTRSGFRLLRSNILQPPTDLSLIQNRFDMIEELVSSSNIFQMLEQILSQFSSIDIEQLLSNLVQIPKQDNVRAAERKIENVIHLKHVISLVEPLINTLSLSPNRIFDKFIHLLIDSRFETLMNEINAIILESCQYRKGSVQMKLEKCHAIKRGFNGLLDVAREAYSESIDDINNLVMAYSEKYDLPLRVSYNTSRGYHAQLCLNKNTPDSSILLPKEFLKVTTTKNAIHFTTELIIARNNRINMSTEEIYLLSNSIITELLQNIRSHIGCLYNLAEVVSQMDLIYSFAYQCSVSVDYVRPDFSNSLAVRQGRHPILEKVLNDKPIANSTYMSEDHNFMIITGPNMSGKSTLLKQVAVLQVMAQIGSYVPAEFASFRICDKLFSRIGSNDDIQTNCSSFMVEMKEMSYILRNLTSNSLVIIDELGRGTSVEEGVGLCFSICEQLLQTKAFTLFVTHFLELTKLENYYYNVSNFNFRVDHSSVGHKTSTNYTHILEPGITKELFYGIRLAESTSLNANIIEDAKIYAQYLQSIQNQPINCGELNPTHKALYKMASIVVNLLKNQQLPDRQTLKDLREQFVYEMETQQEEEDLHSEPFFTFD